MTVHSIGATGRDYATIALWEAACPANLVTSVDTWEGELYNDSEFVITTGIVIAGMTTDATHNVQLRCATGQSFKSSGAVALNYSQSNGVGIRTTTGELLMLQISASFTTLNGLQLHHNTTGYVCQCLKIDNAVTDCVVSQCIFRGGGNNSNRAAMWIGTGANNKLTNCLIIAQRTADIAIHLDSAPSTTILTNLTIVKPSNVTAGGTAVTFNYASSVWKGCAVFGFTTNKGGGGTPNAASDYNATDLSSITGSHSLTSKTYANQFQDSTNDWRVKTGADLHSAAIQFTETGDVDIKGQARSVTTPDIGAWETQSASGGFLNRNFWWGNY